MIKIKQISERINDEIEGAECYARFALEFKENDPQLARVMFQTSEDELGHVNRLHDSVVALINKYRDEVGEPPEAMKAVYDYLHEQQIDRVKKVRILHEMYR